MQHGERKNFPIAVVLAALFLAVAWPGANAFAVLSDTPREETWITNGTVNAIVTTGTTTYIGGSFTQVGPYTGSGVPIDTGTGTSIAVYPKVEGSVEACVPDGAGGWYIGGYFTQVGTVLRNNIAHILPGGTVDAAWNPNANGTVNVLAVSGTTVYVGGGFFSIGGQTRNRIAALDATTGQATSWNPNGNGGVLALAVSGTTVYAGGWFTTIGGQTRNYIAALDATTGLATAWNPNASGPAPYEGRVCALATSGTTVYAGGHFSAIGGQTRSRIAALDATTGLATAWNPNANNPVYVLAVSGTTVYAGGGFTAIGGQTRNYIAALDATTGLATTWNPNASGPWPDYGAVQALAVLGTTVYAAGNFTTIGGQTRSRIAALDAATGLATTWNPNASSTVQALAVSGTTVYAGGVFTGLGWQTRNRIAALDSATGLATAWNPNANGTVRALAVSGTTVYAAGDFWTVGGQPRNYIVALNATTGLATTWNPNANNSVLALAVSGTTVYAGGWFATIGGQTRNYIVALNATTGLATIWNPNANSGVQALAVSGTTVYAGGLFTGVGGQMRNRIAALDATTGLATAWNPNANGELNSLAVSGTTVYAGGGFTAIGGQTRNYIAALDATTGLATTWNPNANNWVQALAVSGTTVYAGGHFSAIGGQTRSRIAALDATMGLATTWNPNADGSVYALAVSGTTVYAGGDSWNVGGLGRPSFVEFRDVAAAATAPSNPGATAIGTNTITWTWTDNSSDESGFKVYDDPGTGPPATLQTTTPSGITALTHTGLSINRQYAFQVAATNVVGDSVNTANFTAWTLAATPRAPTVNNPTVTTLNVTIRAGDGNPVNTEFAFYFTTTGQWVQPGGALGASAAWQTAAAWGTTTVTGLAASTLYSFAATARNGAGTLTAAGPSASGVTLADTTPPTGTILVNGGLNYTGTTGVTLTLGYSDDAGSGVTDMQFSNDGSTWSGWEAAVNTKSWTLDAGDGAKTVYVQYRDAAGNVSIDTISDDITLDTTPPTAVITLTTPSPTSADTVMFTVDFSEPVGASFNDATVSVAGTLAGVAAVTGTDPNYTVTVTLSDPDANGTAGITISGGAVTDPAGNPHAGGSSTLCAVYNWPGFTAQPQGGKLYAGDTHPLQVQVVEGGIPTTYQWKFDNGTTVTDGPAAAQWPLANLALTQAGDYWCEATFDGVMHASNTVTVQVQPRISITTPPEGGDAQSGKSYLFTVTATGGYSPLSYRWKKDGKNIPGANEPQHLRSNLVKVDRGNYSVEISDTNGDRIESAPVTLTVSPGVPAVGLGGLALLAAALAASAVQRGLRRK